MQVFFSLFSKKSKTLYTIIILIGVLNSVLNSAFMVMVSRSITNSNFFIFKGYYPFLFLLFLCICIVMNRLFYAYIIRLSSGIVCEVELNLIRKIRDASFNRMNLLGKEEIYAAIRNLDILGDAPTRFINIFNAFLTIVGCLIYLYWLSFLYGAMLTLMIGLLVCAFVFRSKMRKENYERLRQLEIEYYKYLSDLLSGFKDIRISSTKYENIFSRYIAVNREKAKTIDIGLKHNAANSVMLANYSWYLVLGAVLFLFPHITTVHFSTVSTFVLILVYVITPVSYITGFFPFYAGMKSASKAVGQVYTKITDSKEEKDDNMVAGSLPPFAAITFEQVRFTYFDNKQSRNFTLGPLDLILSKGEIVFITGGNGSGKSTFLNLLSGLERQTDGMILFNETVLDNSVLTSYRNKMAAVFIEAYLMNNNYETFELNENNEQFVKYLRLMKLPESIPVNEIFDRKAALSKGQQKRLTLILALLMENRELLLLDEWAAEQDPVFRDYFYRTVLPYLREEGRTIIAITHDEQYFSCADRVIKFRDGQIIENVLNNTQNTIRYQISQ